VIQVTPVDEGTQAAQEAFARADVAGHRPRLLPGVALPVSALVLEVVFHRRERPGHPAGVAERAQAQVHAVAEALGGGLVQELRQLLAEDRKSTRLNS